MAASRSRRAFLVGCGAAAAASLAWGLWQWRGTPGVPSPDMLDGAAGLADYSGWLVTIEDKAQLLSIANLTITEGTVLAGRALGEDTVADLTACATWCARHPDCTGFSFANATHPDPAVRGRCTVLGSREGEAVRDARFTSGVR